jgi:hypothetical protein
MSPEAMSEIDVAEIAAIAGDDILRLARARRQRDRLNVIIQP